ncbi:phage major capsid protein [Streptococcus fryi]
MNHYTTSKEYNYGIRNYFRNNRNDEINAYLNEGKMPAHHYYQFPSQAFEQLKAHNLFRRIGTVHQRLGRHTNIFMVKPHQAGVETMAVGEDIPAKEVKESQLGISDHKLTTLFLVNKDTVLDKQFNVDAYISGEMAREFGRKEEQLCLLGTGEGEPTGLLTRAEVGSQEDTLTLEGVEALYLSLSPEYRQVGTWIMNEETKLKLHKLVDKNNQPILPYGATELFGHPIEISPFMPTTGKVIAFGDMRKFWLIERHLLSVRALHELYAHQSQIGYLCMERLDSNLTHTDAVKVLEIEA